MISSYYNHILSIDASHPMNISLVCPAYNEEQTIACTLQEVRKALESQSVVEQFELIVVDDGSEDRTVEEARKVTQVRVIQNIKNTGYGASLKRGILEAKYDIILIIDGDNTYPLDALKAMLEQMKNHAMVVGQRDLKLFEYSLTRRFAKWILKMLVYVISGQKVKDMNSGLRLIRKDAVKVFFPIISDGFSFTTTVTLAFYQNSLPIAYVPIEYRKRVGKSKIQPIKDTFQILLLILRTIVFFQPLRIFIFIAFLFFIFASSSLFFDVFIGRNITDKTVLFFATASAFFFAGLIADLIHRRFDILENKLEQTLSKEISDIQQDLPFQESGKTKGI